MTAKPKSSIAPAPKITGLTQAIERCEAAQAAYEAASDSDIASQLSCAEDDAIDALAEMPCASDAEFLEKLRFLLARETNLWGKPGRPGVEFGSLAVAVDCYFNKAKPA
jgi:hypothetical protein